MAVTDTIVCTHITEDPATGAVEVELQWNGSAYPLAFTTRGEMATLMGGGISNPAEATALFFHYWLSRDPDASNDALVNGKTFAIDFGDPNPIKVSG